jgi:hypothetical protein
MSEADLPVIVESAKIKTLLLSFGRNEKDRPFIGTNSTNPLSLRDREFISLSKERARFNPSYIDYLLLYILFSQPLMPSAIK